MDTSSKLIIQTAIQIQRPVHSVFEAIIDPAHMTQYFISKSSGHMKTGRALIWEFPEFKGENNVRVDTIKQDEYISFYWEIGKQEMLVEIVLTPTGEDATIVRITEKEMDNTPEGIQWLKGNTEGWTNFLNCLKAYLEYGINLRKGAFDYLKK